MNSKERAERLVANFLRSDVWPQDATLHGHSELVARIQRALNEGGRRIGEVRAAQK